MRVLYVLSIQSPRHQVKLFAASSVWKTLLAAVTFTMSSLYLASPAQWQQGIGFRSSPLTPLATGKPGFTLLSSDQTGIDFTNHLSDAKAAETQIRLNGSGVALGDINGDGL